MPAFAPPNKQVRFYKDEKTMSIWFLIEIPLGVGLFFCPFCNRISNNKLKISIYRL